MRNLDGTIRMWNQGAERLYGWTAAEMCGRPVRDFIYRDTARYEEANGRYCERGEWRGELVAGLQGWPQDHGQRPLDTGPRRTRRTGIRPHHSHRYHRAEKTRDPVPAFAAPREHRHAGRGGGARFEQHPLAHSPRLSAPPRRSDQGEEKETFLSLVQASAERGANLVKQMLTFARGADGERVLVQPSHLIEEVAKIAGQTFPKSITIRTKYPQDLWMIEGDPTQLQQVLLNLCVNARDAMPDGGTLRLTMRKFRGRRALREHDDRGPARPARPPPGLGRRARHPAARDRQNLRSLFHHQTGGAGDRARTFHRPRDREKLRRLHERLQRAGAHQLPRFSPGQ